MSFIMFCPEAVKRVKLIRRKKLYSTSHLSFGVSVKTREFVKNILHLCTVTCDIYTHLIFVIIDYRLLTRSVFLDSVLFFSWRTVKGVPYPTTSDD